MKPIGFIIIFLSTLFGACNSQKSKSVGKVVEDSNKITITRANSNDSIQNIKSRTQFKDNLQGIWAENEEDNAIFYIKGDSIYYLENFENPQYYKKSNDTLYIFFDGYTSKDLILKLTQDSLILKSEIDELYKLYKR